MSVPTTADWGPCPPGELARLAAQLTFRNRLRTAAGVALGLLLTAGLAGAGWVAASAAFGGKSPPACAPCHQEGVGCGGQTAGSNPAP
jgi:hypothetical protein